MLTLLPILVFVLFSAVTTFAQVNVPANDPNIEYVGRWDKSNSSLYHSYWGGAYLRASVMATGIAVSEASAVNFWADIDGTGYVYYTGAVGTVAITNNEPLNSGTHVLTVVVGFDNLELQIQGLTLSPGGATVASANPNKPLIEFIGDSITCGLETPDEELNAYGWVVSGWLNCDHTHIAFPGITLVDGYHYTYAGSPQRGMSAQYVWMQEPLSSVTPVVSWNVTNYAPNIVVINLGANDSGNVVPYSVPYTIFQSYYANFLQDIRNDFPNAVIIALRPFSGVYAPQIANAVSERNGVGDHKLHYVDTTGWISPVSDTYDGTHPTVIGHLKIATHLAPILDAYLTNAFASGPMQVVQHNIGLTPQMGWSDMAAYGCADNEWLITNTVGIMAGNGMQAAGYHYINLDSCWQQVWRNSDGVLAPKESAWPDGFPWLSGCLNSQGFTFGLYTDHGTNTCDDITGQPGSFGYEYIDAFTFGQWGVGYLKDDSCSMPAGDIPEDDYYRMSDGLMKSQHPVFFSLCEGLYNFWSPATGNSWRTTYDINDTFPNIISHLDLNSRYTYLAGPGRWNDPDVLLIGWGDFATNNPTAAQTYFTMWCEMSAPLIESFDLRYLPSQLVAILTNAEAIAVDQDPAGEQGICVGTPDPIPNGAIINGTYEIADEPGFVLADPGSGGVGTGVIQWTNYLGKEQQWNITHVSGNEYKILCAANGLALSGPTAGAQLVLQNYTGASDQLWTFVANGSYYNIINAGTGQAMDDWGGGGSQVVGQYAAYSSNPNQCWNLGVGGDIRDFSELWSKPLGYDFTTRAVALLNRSINNSTTITCNWNSLGFQSGTTATVRDLWTHQNLGTFTNSFTATLAPYSSRLLKIVGTPMGPPSLGTNYLTSLQPIYSYVNSNNNWIAFGWNQSIARNNLKMQGVSYSNGLGVCSMSGFEYNLGGVCSSFQAVIGLDDEAGGKGAVIFQVFADGRKIYDSGIMTSNTPPQSINLDMTGVRRLTLGVSATLYDRGPGQSYPDTENDADWVNAQVVVNSTTPATPETPTGLSASPGNAVTLNWNPTLAALAYNVKRATSSGGSYTTIATNVPITTFTDSNVVNGTTYYYAVSAVSSFGQGSNSGRASATAQYVPPPPVIISAAPGLSGVLVYWNASSGASSYNVYRFTSGTPPVRIASGVANTYYTDTSAFPGADYYYLVTSVNSGLESGYSLYATSGEMVQNYNFVNSGSHWSSWAPTNWEIYFIPGYTELDNNGRIWQDIPATFQAGTSYKMTVNAQVSCGKMDGLVLALRDVNANYQVLADTTVYFPATDQNPTNCSVPSSSPQETFNYLINWNTLSNAISGTPGAQVGNHIEVAITPYENSGDAGWVDVSSVSFQTVFNSGTFNMIDSAGYYLADPGSQGAGTGMIEYTGDGGAEQQWNITWVTNNDYMITCDVNKLSLTGATPNGQLTLQNYTGSSDQLWMINPNGSDYNIVNVATAQAMDDWGGGGNGNIVGQLPENASVEDQVWNVVSPYTPYTPQFKTISVNGTTLNISASDGSAYGTCHLLMSTNLALPLNQWAPVLTNIFDGNGNLKLSTHPINPNDMQEFYRLQLQ
ncbi:MAG TPA: NPCBM/NEW2 domain-containing protein [Candidatus Acidoferrum sp.]|nr:NPCBM/NEW2 domain-containing protein [Candidatus Acidoferrum sp.]